MSDRQDTDTHEADPTQHAAGEGPGSGDRAGGRDERSPRERLTEALHAFRDSFEETISEARERGDVSTGKAREMLRTAAGRARSATADAREKFDFVTQGEFDDLMARVARLEARLGDQIGGSTDADQDQPGPDGS
jgi:hypothetical protein